jgi:hypothetical protein
MQSVSTTNILRVVIPIVITSSTLAIIITFLAFSASTVYKPKDGLDCWDKNGNGKCDLETEDVFRDGACNYRDCSVLRGINGVNGTNGINCWDRNGDGICNNGEDITHDNQCDEDDCFFICNGIACWDLNENGICDLETEDITQDGICSSLDCRGRNGEDSCSCYQCWDTDKDGYCTLPDEDRNNDGVCNETDCRGSNGFSCWDLNQNFLCDLETEDINNDTVCNNTDCQGARGIIGFPCWDTIIQNFECDDGEDVTGDDICDEDDCLPIQCWDLNQDRQCNLTTEDFTLDGVCNVSDCSASHWVYSSLAIPNTIVLRDSNASFAVDTITANQIYVSEAVIAEPGATLSASNLATQHIVSETGDLTLQSTSPILYDVIVNDDLYVDGELYVNGISANPSTGNLIISGGDIIINGTLVVETLSASVTNITVVADVNVTGRMAANTISGVNLNNLTLSPTSGNVIIAGNLAINATKTLYVDEIRSVSNGETVVSSPLSLGNVSIDQIFGITEFLTMFVKGLYLNGTLRISSFESLFSSAVSFPTGIQTSSIFGSNSLTLSSETGYVNVNGTLRVDNVTSYTNNSDLFMSGQGSGNVTISKLKTDSISESTSGASTTFQTGVKFSNSASGYTPTKLDYLEQLNVTYPITSVFTTNTTSSFIYFREGPIVKVSLRAAITGTMLSTRNITLTGTVVTRMLPNAKNYFPVYCLAPTSSTGCIFEMSTSGSLLFSFAGSAFTSSTAVTILPFTKSYSVS